MLGIIVTELQEVRENFGDERRTEIVGQADELEIEDLIVEEEMVVTVSHTGYIKRNSVRQYRAQRRGGKGKSGMQTKEQDFVESLFVASTHSFVLFFTDRGKVHWLKVHNIPKGGGAAKGKAIINMLELEKEEMVASMLPVREFEEGKYVVMATKKGVVKKTSLKAYSHPKRKGIIALRLDEGDELIATGITDGEKDIFFSTRRGQSLRCHESEIRDMGRVARGIRSMTLEEDDDLVGMEIISEGATILTITENGFGKRTLTSEYPLQKRGGKGVITIKTTERNGSVVGICPVVDEDDLMIITEKGRIIRIKVRGISVIGRNTQGVKLINLGAGERVVALARVEEEEAEEDEEDIEADIEVDENSEA